MTSVLMRCVSLRSNVTRHSFESCDLEISILSYSAVINDDECVDYLR